MVGYDDIHSQCFKDTVSAYQKVRQDGELHLSAFIAALKDYKKHEGKAEDKAPSARVHRVCCVSRP